MNYRHAFHAGNFADVVKHAVLARIVAYLKEKPAAFRVIDTHAGAGLYDLSGAEASRTGEWRGGIGRLLTARLAPAVDALLAPYLEAVASFNDGEVPRVYPGSPGLLRYWLRVQDRMIACEAEPVAAQALSNGLRGDKRIKAVAIDGYTALKAYLPPKERRGLVLTDPPFEQPDEFVRLADALGAAYRKWPTGIYMLWYPIKDVRAAEGFGRNLARRGIARMLRAEVTVAAVRDGEKLAGSGLILVNPPWTLEGELAVLLPALADILALEKASARVDWLAGEK
ncbi:MAG: 23S rRNA (adenine(2030)-N(6))-methyltransferase RlmJ [Alphaproteobacteria bacterium]|nr:23S rRNA (adenine(2030)-N(6))-methyltransferase RlmJ [Alphaproteobacteria bacterium]